MKNFIVYDESTGTILRTGQCPDSLIGLQIRSGQKVMEGVANDATHYIKDGVITLKE